MMLLLKAFASPEAIRQADVEVIARMPGLNRKLAEEIKRALGPTEQM
jgi:excinuclease UvrABC nuclease subunit